MANCKGPYGCGAPITWAINEATGKRVPLDPDPTPDGNIILLTHKADDGSPLVRFLKKNQPITRDGLRYVSHFATCPNAKSHRKK